MTLLRVATQIATVLGTGRVPYAPGTVASLIAVPFAWLIVLAGGGGWSGRFLLLIAGLITFAVGAWACELYSHDVKNPDPSECVIDEVAGQWIACAFAPFNLPGYVLAFVLFRAFDIAKPWPVSWAERAPGGLGIMLDDVVAGLMAAVIIAAVTHTGLV